MDHFIYEYKSQDYRTVDVGRDLWMSFGPNSLLKQGYLEPAAQVQVQRIFDYVQD